MNDSAFSRRHVLCRFALASAAAATPMAVGTGPAAAQARQPGGARDGTGVQATNLPNAANREGEIAEVNGARIFYQVTGEGEPVVLLHGYPLSGALFSRVRHGLAGRHRVITIDHRGYGASSTPGVPDSIGIYARDALAVMQRLGIERAAIGGMSMGGPIALSMYKEAPQRFSALMLIDTIAAAANPAEAGLWRGVAEMVRQKGVDAIHPVLIKEMLTGDTRAHQPALTQYLEYLMRDASRDAAIGGATALAQRPDHTALLGQVRVPTLVYVGLEDSGYPVEIAREMHQAIGGSSLEVIPDAAHAAIFERPEPSVQAILRFTDMARASRTGSSR